MFATICRRSQAQQSNGNKKLSFLKHILIASTLKSRGYFFCSLYSNIFVFISQRQYYLYPKYSLNCQKSFIPLQHQSKINRTMKVRMILAIITAIAALGLAIWCFIDGTYYIGVFALFICIAQIFNYIIIKRKK